MRGDICHGFTPVRINRVSIEDEHLAERGGSSSRCPAQLRDRSNIATARRSSRIDHGFWLERILEVSTHLEYSWQTRARTGQKADTGAHCRPGKGNLGGKSAER